jgi:hypothetical protein
MLKKSSNKKCIELSSSDDNLTTSAQNTIIPKKNITIIDNNDKESNDIITFKEFKSKELMHYNKLNSFFDSCSSEEHQMMVDIINGNHLISLRFLDWFVTRYCYLYKLNINVNNVYKQQENLNINISYKAQLKSFKKKYFDPFRRKKKFYYTFNKNNLILLTTIGQLNFFRWAISHDIIKYTETNYRTITTQLSHVNKYFKKNIIDNISFISTSDENIDSDSIINSNKDTNISLKNTEHSIYNDTLKKEYKNIKDINSKYKNPVVSRNIFLEF